MFSEFLFWPYLNNIEIFMFNNPQKLKNFAYLKKKGVNWVLDNI